MRLIGESSCFFRTPLLPGEARSAATGMLGIVGNLFQLTINSFGSFTFLNAYEIQFTEIHIQ